MSLMEDGIDIICLQETKRRKDNLQGELKFEGYKVITVEREGQVKQGRYFVITMTDDGYNWIGFTPKNKTVKKKKYKLVSDHEK